MKRRIFAWITTLLGIVLALGAVEVTAIFWLWLEDGHYTPAAELFERTQNSYVRDVTRDTGCRYVDTLFPHPYLGFVHHANPPCGLPYINNVGLFGHDYPVLKPADRYVLLLAGGSVASQLAQNWEPNLPNYLEVELNKRYKSPNGKPWLVLNGGDGAWKQPQQFILFGLYANAVDAMITLDGFNEHYFFYPGTMERLERPLNNFLEVNPFVADENFGDAAIGWVVGRAAGALAKNPILGRSHAAYMIIRGIESVAKSKDIFKSTKKTTLNGLFAITEEIRSNHQLAFDTQMGLYHKYIRGMEAIAHEYNIKSAYFIQPIPAWGKTLTPEEKEVAADLSYAPLYRRMVAGLLTLRDRGIPIFDLGDMLQNESRTIYVDHIHFIRNRKTGESPGYTMMAERVSRLLAETWKLEPK